MEFIGNIYENQVKYIENLLLSQVECEVLLSLDFMLSYSLSIYNNGKTHVFLIKYNLEYWDLEVRIYNDEKNSTTDYYFNEITTTSIFNQTVIDCILKHLNIITL